MKHQPREQNQKEVEATIHLATAHIKIKQKYFTKFVMMHDTISTRRLFIGIPGYYEIMIEIRTISAYIEFDELHKICDIRRYSHYLVF